MGTAAVLVGMALTAVGGGPSIGTRREVPNVGPTFLRLSEVGALEARQGVLPMGRWGYVAGGTVNPVLVARRGDAVDLTFRNMLGGPSIVHWHGLEVDWRHDGHPSYQVAGGGTYRYSFTVRNRGGTYWYHPHPMPGTAEQAYMGLAGFLIVEDADTDVLRDSGFELGVNDVALAIQDVRLSGGAAPYSPTMMDIMMGMHGWAFLVNGVQSPRISLRAGTNRLRLLNASNARVYRVSVVGPGNRQLPMKLIAVDGGLLERPIEVREVLLGPGERAEVVVELGMGVHTLRARTWDPAPPRGGPMGRGPMPHVALAERTVDLATIVVGERGDVVEVPAELSAVPEAAPPVGRRGFTFFPVGHGRWSIGGMTWNYGDYLHRHMSASRNVEVWTLHNPSPIPHPMHIHGYHFHVLRRVGTPEMGWGLAVDRAGRLATDLGLKDTVLVMPGETVEILVDLDNGLRGQQVYLFHCHNLEHEDHGMMVNLYVED